MDNNQILRQLKSGNLDEKKEIWRQLKKEADEKGIYFATYPFGKTKSKNPDYKMISLSKVTHKQLKNILADKNTAKQTIFTLARTDLGRRNFPPFVFATQLITAALNSTYKGPIYMLAQLELNPAKYKHTVQKELNLTKKQIKNSRQVGVYNFNINYSVLRPELVKITRSNLDHFAEFLETKVEKKPQWARDNIWYKKGYQKIIIIHS